MEASPPPPPVEEEGLDKGTHTHEHTEGGEEEQEEGGVREEVNVLFLASEHGRTDVVQVRPYTHTHTHTHIHTYTHTHRPSFES